MQKKFYILLFLFTTASAFAQISQENRYKLAFPDNISSNATFDISLIASNPFNEANKLVLYFNFSRELIFKNLELRTFDNIINIPCIQITPEGIQGIVYRAVIDLDKNKIIPQNYYQFLFTFRAENATLADFGFSGILKDNNSTLGYIQSQNNLTEEDTLKFSSVQLNFYKTQKLAGNSVSLVPGSEINLEFSNSDVKDLVTEFWIKLNNKQTEFLRVLNIRSGETLFDISTNPFQMVTVQSQNNLTRETINSYFLGRGSWYHFSIISSFDKNEMKIYCGNTLIGNFRLPSFLKINDLQWKFVNESQSKSFQLDLLRFIDLNDNTDLSYLNEHYLNFIGKNTRVLYQFNFDNEEELYLAKNSLNINFNPVYFLKSDAPIFARAPELNINILGNLYELTWKGGDYKQAKYYVLEKSVDNSDFQKVSSVQADNTAEKEYSQVDARDPSTEIVYYRIKQVNVNGSAVYSSSVKIGQGTTEPFVVEQNYPNPFNPRTSIVVDLLQDSDVEITIYNLEGKEITKLFKGFLTSGTHKFSFNASELPSGIYLYKVSTPDFSNTKKMILTK